MTTEYKIEDIRKILSKIENLKDRKHIEKVKKIIFDENPDVSTIKKSSGVLLFFHNLTQDTYKKLELFFCKLETEKISRIATTLTESCDRTLSDIDSEKNEPRIKLSNAEKKLIKKKEYHKEIEQRTDDVYISDDDIFLNKN